MLSVKFQAYPQQRSHPGKVPALQLSKRGNRVCKGCIRLFHTPLQPEFQGCGAFRGGGPEAEHLAEFRGYQDAEVLLPGPS